MKLSSSFPRSGAFTLLELLATITVISVLAALVVAGATRVLNSAKKAQATSDLRTLSQAFASYVGEHNGRYPNSSGPGAIAPYWTDLIASYLPESRTGTDYNGITYKLSPALVSPLLPPDRHHRMGDFGVNGAVFLRSLEAGDVPAKWRSAASPMLAAAVKNPSQTVSVMTAETASVTPPVGSWYVNTANYVNSPDGEMLRPSDHGTGYVFCAFADGHTEEIPIEVFTQDRKKYLVPSQ